MQGCLYPTAGAPRSPVDTLRQREAKRDALVARIDALEKMAAVTTIDRGALRADLKRRTKDSREPLKMNVAQSRQLLRKVLADRLTVTPKGGSERYSAITGDATFTVFPKGMASPAGSDVTPCEGCRLTDTHPYARPELAATPTRSAPRLIPEEAASALPWRRIPSADCLRKQWYAACCSPDPRPADPIPSHPCQRDDLEDQLEHALIDDETAPLSEEPCVVCFWPPVGQLVSACRMGIIAILNVDPVRDRAVRMIPPVRRLGHDAFEIVRAGNHEQVLPSCSSM
jgi:hypothetical protein